MRPDVGQNTVSVWLIDWKRPEKNDFAIAEELTITGADTKAHAKRPDVVLYVNGSALDVLELRRSTVSVAEGIPQNRDNQKKIFIERHHNDKFVSLMDRHLPSWRLHRQELNSAPLGHDNWTY